MEEKNELNQVMEEYEVMVEGLNYKIKGKVLKSVSDDGEVSFIGSLSHYCKPDEGSADVYRPSLGRREIESARHLLIQYLKSFTNIDVEQNMYY